MRRPELWPEADLLEVQAYRNRQHKKPSDVWQPQPKQFKLLQLCGLHDALEGGQVHPALCGLIGYGGAAGGGKSEGMIGVALIALQLVPGVKIGYFRRKFTELEGPDGPIERSQFLFPKIGGVYNKQNHVWRFGKKDGDEDWNEGSAPAFRFCHCQYESDVNDYQSSAFDILLIDEATHFTWSIIRFLLTRNRISGHSKLPKPFAIMSTNPGGVGHMWFKQIFDIKDRIDEARKREND
jgi:hypothetical protein